MTQHNTAAPETVSTLEKIVERYEIRLMAWMVEEQEFEAGFTAVDYEKAVEWIERLKQDAEKNDASAQYTLGVCYEQGMSEEWCKVAKRIVEIQNLLQQRIEEDPQYKALQEQILLEAQSKQSRAFSLRNQRHEAEPALLSEDLRAELTAARQFIDSPKTYREKKTTKPELAVHWYEKAIQNGNNNACFDLGLCYLRGFGVAQDQQKGFALLNQAAVAGNQDALELLGHCYAEGVMVNKDLSKARDYWNKAEAAEYTRKPIHDILKQVIWRAPDDEPCFDDRWHKREKKLQKEKEQRLLFEETVQFYLKKGYFREDQLTVFQNFLDWATNQDRQGHEEDITARLALGYSELNYREPDTLDSTVWLRRYVAEAWYSGTPGIDKDQCKALQLWQGLADNGDPWACCRLGCHYLNQNLPEFNASRALAYFNKAAERDFYPAHFALAIIHYFGVNTEIDLDLALAHIDQAVGIDQDAADIAQMTKIQLSSYDNYGEDIEDIYGLVGSYKAIDFRYSPHFIEKIRLACLLFGESVSNRQERLQKQVAMLVENLDKHKKLDCYYFFEVTGEKSTLLDRESTLLDKVRDAYADNSAMLILCQYALALGMDEEEFFSGKDDSGIRMPHVGKSLILDLEKQKTTRDWHYIIGCPVVFDALFVWIYQEYYDPLLLGALYFYKWVGLEPSACKPPDENSEIALIWLQGSDNYKRPWASWPLSTYYQARIHELNDPKRALEILSKSVEKMDISLKIIRLDLQTRIELRIQALKAQRHARRAEAEAARANDLKTRLEKLVQRTSHTLANTIFPNTLYQVAEHLKDKVELRRDALLLLDAYHAEVSIRHENELLQQRYTTDNPEPLRQIMRGDRRNLPDAEARSIEELFDYALSRVIARILNAHSAKFEPIRRQIIGDKELTLDAMRQDFEEAMFFREPPMTAQAWCRQNLRPVELLYRNAVWREIGLKREGLAEALLYGHFAEILFNAFKYADHAAADFLQVELDEVYQNNERYLTLTWRNPVSTNRPSGMGSGQGLEAIKEDLRQLNGQHEAAPTLDSWQDNGYFCLRLGYQADLLWLQPMPEVDIARFLFKD